MASSSTPDRKPRTRPQSKGLVTQTITTVRCKLNAKSMPADLRTTVAEFLQKDDLIAFSESRRGVYNAISHKPCGACQDHPILPQEVYENHAAAAAERNKRLVVFDLHPLQGADSNSSPNANAGKSVSRYAAELYAPRLANAVTVSGSSILSLAVCRSRIDVVGLLLRHCADANYGGENTNRLPLDHLTSPFRRKAGRQYLPHDPDGLLRGAVAIVETLLAHGARFTRRAPWEIILWTGRADLIHRAVRNGVDLSKLTWGTSPPLNPLTALLHHPTLTAEKVTGAVLHAILSSAPRLMDITDECDRTFIHQVILAGHWNLAIALLPFPSKRWPIATDGTSALTLAIAHGKTRLIGGLMDRSEYELDYMHDTGLRRLGRNLHPPAPGSLPLLMAIDRATEFPRGCIH
ncbi:uncharacterized protein BP01DRAFT_381431 [Aspergillus saccharolyticus JOP 1030-1]|uniref:Ankyrin n=1 Tax=Aspergillus saccharolyticus JOP 1030-1 TaxID=1450539 RepID=A0A318ZSS7_9EURO|nr:hypothetical protein BP01DRAFT_381431 [Aspergillus saccharolyticus JOP 1030-1]PYH47010.1 hypothetical protein BP01DRAFT_381431 [Aspergillus saccharolyticus JOP 1030-1]